MRPARWMKCLSAPGAALRAVPGCPDRFGVYPGGDLRRRPSVTLSGAQVRQALGEGWLSARSHGVYELTHKLDDIRARQSGNFKAPHQLVREQAVMEGECIRRITSDISDSPLARWMRPDAKTGKSWLTDDEFEAGERLRADYHRSMMTERVTSDWNSYLAPAATGSRAGRGDAPASAMAAQQRVRSALEAVGPGMDRILSAVCLREKGLEVVETEESWPRRSGKIVLKLALQQLGRHYGMAMPG
ncbi:DUF6456 domain-containing protein [Hyphobacterium sp. HN65]|uniref:DUF6456 domain-containing protein n=1 Tax=Hyphobacterium lacteum TaxID=3116575 RepID=A0ABU7LT19_9PROT|nr:DUF6456 domain-containing protein [Hyphobacterium sp. HN65]MEE2527038.1 DUF6456 domain-containing protein [Hyphobacterium sp. HN65]